MEKQRTIAHEFSLAGTGLHSGNKVTLTFRPAPENAGVVFFRSDLAGRPAIKACAGNIKPKSESMRYSFLEVEGGVRVTTVEHLLAACLGMGIDNVYVDVDAEELPGLDGSSLEYIKAIEKAGAKEQDAPRTYFVIKEPVYVEENGVFVIGLPDTGFSVSYSLDYRHPRIGCDFYQTAVTPADFGAQVAPARTFCLEEEVEALRKAGLGKGATYENALVVGASGVIGNQLRFPNEFVRHKVLDLIGDLFLLGQPLKGKIIAVKSGHSMNLRFVKKLTQSQEPSARPAAPLAFGETLDITQIMQILPHRQPFLLVDRVLHVEPGKKAIGIKNVTMNEYFFEGHFPGKPVMPGVLIIEAMAQVSGVMMLMLNENRGKIAYFMSINNAKFRRMVVPGDQLVFEVEAVKVKSRTVLVHGTASVDGKLAAEADLMCAFGE